MIAKAQIFSGRPDHAFNDQFGLLPARQREHRHPPERVHDLCTDFVGEGQPIFVSILPPVHHMLKERRLVMYDIHDDFGRRIAMHDAFCEIICQMPVKFGCFSEVTLSSAGRI